MNTRPVSLLICALTAVPALAQAQTAAPELPDGPRIAVSASAQATAPPAHGRFSVDVESLAASAAQAGADSARITQAVLQALQQAGLAAGDMKGTRASISPRWQYNDKTHRQERDGFGATTTINVDTAALSRLGAYIDAALNAGATSVSDVRYFPADPQALRRQALARAVQSARGDAEAIAAAAGGSLGELLQIGTGSGITPESGYLQEITVTGARVAGPGTAIVPADIEVSATVSAQWRLVVPAGR